MWRAHNKTWDETLNKVWYDSHLPN